MVVLVIISSLLLVLSFASALFTLLYWYRKIEEAGKDNQPKKVAGELDLKTLTYEDGTRPLEAFTPDFSKEVGLQFLDSDDGHGVKEVESK